MKPQDFVHELNRMCTYYKGQCEENNCELEDIGCYINGDTKDDDFAKMYDTVAAWSDAYPVRTRRSEFLKLFPFANIDEDGIPCILPCDIQKTECLKNCPECRKRFWLAPINESEEPK